MLQSKIFYFLQEFYQYLVINILIFVLSLILIFKIHKSRLQKGRKFLATAIISTVLFLCLNFTLLEAYFRFIYDDSDSLGFLKISENWQKRHVVFNGDFRRDREFTLKKQNGVDRICALGDSITFGYGIENPKDRYTDILENHLQKEGFKIEIYNLAISGVNFRDATTTYRQYEYLNCDIILYQYVLNDIRDNERQAKLLQEYSKVTPVLKKAQNFSYFFDFIYWRLNQRYTDSFQQLQAIDFADFEDEEKLNRHLSEITLFLEEIKQDQKKIIVVIFPMFYSLDNYPGWIHIKIGGQFKKGEAAVVDLLPFAAGKNLYDLRASRFDAHPNELFHSLAAQEVYESLKELLK